MHNKKYNNKTQNFIQGLRPFSNSIPHGLKKILKKSGYNFNNIVDNWTKMVGKKVSDASYPVTIKIGKEMIDGTLVLNVIHGKELEIEYNKQTILEKINSFFGYKIIDKVKLNIVQEKKIKTKEKNIADQNCKFKNKLVNLKNDDLKKSLNKLVKAYNEKNI